MRRPLIVKRCVATGRCSHGVGSYGLFVVKSCRVDLVSGKWSV